MNSEHMCGLQSYNENESRAHSSLSMSIWGEVDRNHALRVELHDKRNRFMFPANWQ